jgi:hypothetical protein
MASLHLSADSNGAATLPAKTAPLPFPDLRDKAILSYGEECSKKSIELMQAFNLPGGLLPLKDVIEGGYVEDTGFVWILTRSKQQHHFKRADRLCKYEELVTCRMEKKKIKEIKGVKAKDMMLWVSVNEIVKDDTKEPAKLHFKSFAGLSRSFPAEYFSTDS